MLFCAQVLARKQDFSPVRSNYFTLYRDIKPENFLIKNKNDISNVKLIDFGLSKDFSEAEIM